MNKKIMSIAAIITTVVTVATMIYNSNSYTTREEDYSGIKNSRNIVDTHVNKKQNDIVEKNKSSDAKNGVQKNLDDDKNQSSIEENNTNESLTDQNSQQDNNTVEDNSTVEGNNTVEESDSSQNDNKEDEKSNVPVFKVSKNEIMDKLSFIDKAKILAISKSLSPGDFNKLQEDINDNDEKKGMTNAAQLLKTRLSEDDFDNMKNIASKFINLDALN
jgi:hypothetical protein